MKQPMWFLTWNTGLSAIYNDLIQVAASKMHSNITAEFDEFINPGHHFCSLLMPDLTGITDHVRNAKPLEKNKILRSF